MIARVELTFTASAVLANHIFHVCDRGGYRGGSWVLKNHPSPSYHLLQKSLYLHYHQHLSSLYMLDSVCQTPL